MTSILKIYVFHMASCMSPVLVSENHQHYLFMRQKTKLIMLRIKKLYNKKNVFKIYYGTSTGSATWNITIEGLKNNIDYNCCDLFLDNTDKVLIKQSTMRFFTTIIQEFWHATLLWLKFLLQHVKTTLIFFS